LELRQVTPLSVDRTYCMVRVSVGALDVISWVVSRKKTNRSPFAVRNGIGYEAAWPSATDFTVQVPAIECGCADRARTSLALCSPTKISSRPSAARTIVG
jgi:hypothetical protein